VAMPGDTLKSRAVLGLIFMTTNLAARLRYCHPISGRFAYPLIGIVITS